MPTWRFVLGGVLVAASANAQEATEAVDLGDIVVTAPTMRDPLNVVLDPRAAQQPIPAPDGAAYLKNVPGFAVSRKGGTDGDPAFRGLGGSRLNILLDDSTILGGCPNRMDPPTAYVYPESYDEITVQKGPQSVLYGASSAATVRFDRQTERFAEPGVRGMGSLVLGSFGRNDQFFDVTGGQPNGFARMIGTRSHADNYEDGNGDEVHSFYTRWSATAMAGWTPNEDTRLELTVDRSDGEAAYADRGMDGVAFDREGYALAWEQTGLGPRIERIEARVYHNYVDHIMDNFSLRTASGTRRVMNPERTTVGGRVAVQLGFGPMDFATVGVDAQANEHTSRMAMAMMPAQPDPSLSGVARTDKARFHSVGIFGEYERDVTLRDRLIAGLRVDRVQAEAEQSPTMMDPDAYGGASPGDTDTDTNTSGFLRYEHDLDETPATLYVGLGRAERSPDFWERDRVFDLATETHDQLELGMGYGGGRLRANAALFYASVADYILITNDGDDAANIDATLYGGEVDVEYRLNDHWRAKASLAYVHGTNDTDDKPLAQISPLEGTLELRYRRTRYSAGVLVRGVARQDRVDVGSGTIYGTDIGETPGFGVVSVHGGYRPAKTVTIAAGIDNLFDRTYSEHLARGSADLGTVTGRVDEPGRAVWLKVSGRF